MLIASILFAPFQSAIPWCPLSTMQLNKPLEAFPIAQLLEVQGKFVKWQTQADGALRATQKSQIEEDCEGLEYMVSVPVCDPMHACFRGGKDVGTCPNKHTNACVTSNLLWPPLPAH